MRISQMLQVIIGAAQKVRGVWASAYQCHYSEIEAKVARLQAYVPAGLAAACVVAVLVPEIAAAADGTVTTAVVTGGGVDGAASPWNRGVNNVLALLTGGLTAAIATVAVIALGIMAMAGKLSWDHAIKIVLGIVLMFGAAYVVSFIGGGMGTMAINPNK
jgi:type IV secretory pathway VirB2 component (pilin)